MLTYASEFGIPISAFRIWFSRELDRDPSLEFGFLKYARIDKFSCQGVFLKQNPLNVLEKRFRFSVSF